jgi:hypothetical protein
LLQNFEKRLDKLSFLWYNRVSKEKEGEKMEKFIPQNGVKAIGKNCEVYTYDNDNVLYAVAYKGKAKKPAFHYRFKNEDQRAEYVSKFIADQNRIFAQREKEKADLKAKKEEFIKSLKIGDIFLASWGWEQTNTDVYQLVSLKGKTGTFRAIAQESVKTISSMSENRKAVPDAFVGREFTSRFDNYGNIKVKYGNRAHRIDPDEKFYCSWYA